MRILCGVDMVLDSRIAQDLGDRSFVSRIYHRSELGRMDAKKLAGIFALKEAVFKALDVPAGHWLDVEVSYRRTGKPRIELSGAIRREGISSIDCSVSHEGGMTQAMVVILLGDDQTKNSM